MRALGAAALVLVLTAAGTGVAVSGAAADDHDVPTRQEVQAARAAVGAQAADVATVQARLAVANQRLQQSAIAAEQAAEAYNGARWRAAQARQEAAEADRQAAAAEADVRRQRQAYGDAVVSTYELSPQLTALAAIADADGIGTVVEHTQTLRTAESALGANYDSFRAADVVAGVASDRADRTRQQAEDAADEARAARDRAQAAADAAAADARSIAAEKDALLRRLADLQHVSVELAQRRQSALEARAAAAAAAAAQKEAQEAAQEQAENEAEAAAAQAAQQAEAQAPQQANHHQTNHATHGSRDHGTTTSAAPAAPSPPPAPQALPAPPAPAGGASAAIAFARAQIGEPYVWGAAGPDAWDCSGLVQGAWRAGGTYLPHYSVAQYEQSTPISPSQLQPGDLVFWGSSSSPSSIYHVALYAGSGMIIEAPRTGVPVREVSMYAWIAPNFYARP